MIVSGVAMASPEVHVDYLAIGANRHTAVADWSDRGIIAFGAGHNIALWRPKVSGLYLSLSYLATREAKSRGPRTHHRRVSSAYLAAMEEQSRQ